MIVLFVEQGSGLIRKWMDVPPEWIALQSLPSGQVAVLADRFPNYPAEGYVKALSRRPDLDIPEVPIPMHSAQIDQRRAPVKETPNG